MKRPWRSHTLSPTELATPSSSSSRFALSSSATTVEVDQAALSSVVNRALPGSLQKILPSVLTRMLRGTLDGSAPLATTPNVSIVSARHTSLPSVDTIATADTRTATAFDDSSRRLSRAFKDYISTHVPA